jgi:hypothetical protein
MKQQQSPIFILVIGLALVLAPVMPARAAGMQTLRQAPPFSVYLPLIKTGRLPCLVAPTLVSPTNGSTLDNLIPLYEWNSGNDPAATIFMMSVARDPGFTQVVDSLGYGSGHGPGNFRFYDNLDPATTYYWRAYLRCGNSVQSPYSDVWSFTSGSGGTLPPAPGLIAPANGSTLPGLGTILQWSSVSGAVEYQVLYTKSGGGSYAAVFNGLQYDTGSLDPSSTYEWYAVARTAYAWSNQSVHWTFTTGVAGP